MNCREIQSLLPLYVEGDLSDPEADAVRRHLQGCVGCRETAGEFEASQQWLRSIPAPEFKPQELAALRSAVRTRIERETHRYWRPLLAAAAVLALAATAVLLLQLERNGSGQRPSPVARVEPTTPATLPGPQPAAVAPSVPDAPAPPIPKPEPKRRPAAAAAPVPSVPPPAEVVAAVTQPADAPVETLRIELQTADPNIRIIWFAPKPASRESSSPLRETDD